MTKNGFLAENNLEFWKFGALLHVHISAWSVQQNADRIYNFNAEMGKKHTKNQVIESEIRKWQMRGYTIYPKWPKQLFRYYRTVPNRIANCTEQYNDFLIFFYRPKKKLGSGPKL